jgi:hypothetical protein
MTTRSGWRPPAALSFVLLTGLLAAACAGGIRAWDLAGHPGLLLDVKRYYETNATEEFGRCTSPLLEGVSAADVLEETPERLTVRVRYYYRDAFRDWDEGCDARGGGLLTRMCRTGRIGNPPCRGFSDRTFTIDKRGERPEVATMTGPQRGRARFGG